MSAVGARITGVRVGRPLERARPDWDHARSRTWTSAYGKDEVAGAVRIGTLGLEGDEQFDHKHHGGPDMAVLAYSLDHYERWREEFGAAARGPGGFGENFVIAGLDEEQLCIGDVLRAGGVRLEVSQPRGPCANISRWWDAPGMLARVTESGRTGWYLRVIEAGEVRAGDPVERLERPNDGWTVLRVFRARVNPGAPREHVAFLASCPQLSAEWRKKFVARLES